MAIRHGHNRANGGKPTPTYNSWASMVQRCTDPNYHSFSKYGGRGVRVCDRWRTFVNFLADMGERPDGATLDRIDNDGDYEPGNCRWATPRQQSNNRRNTLMLTFRGETRPLTEWAEITGIRRHTIWERVHNMGWTAEKALSRTDSAKGDCARKLEFGGESHSIDEWARRLGLSRSTIDNRLRRLGWSVEKALTTPAKK